MAKRITKTRVRKHIRDTRFALRQLEKALVENADIFRCGEEVIETAEMTGRAAQGLALNQEDS